MKLLLLVQNDSDVAHLDGAAKAILRSSIAGVWVVFSPAITVNASEAAAKLDGEIAQLKSAEQAAAGRADYEAASGYKMQREGKELDRQKALRDAWKTAPEDARKKRTQEIFASFSNQLQSRGGMNIKITGHGDHYDREQWVAMLNSLSGAWFKPFTPGSFVVAWPESVETSVKEDSTEFFKRVAEESANAVAVHAKLNATPLSREDELMTLHHMKLRPIMTALGLEFSGSKEQMVAKILAAESAKAEPVTANVDSF